MTNLKRIRTGKQISRIELSEKSGVNLRMIQYYEQGYKDINKIQGITLYKLSQVLKCNMADLLELKKEVGE